MRVPLNPAASLIWACLDGASSIGEIAADVAQGFAIPFETALADVIATVRDFVTRGIAFDARGDAPPLPPPDPRARPLLDTDFPLGPEGELVVLVADTLVGLRTNDRESAAILRALLAPALADVAASPEPAAPDSRLGPRLALVSTPDRGRVAGMHFVHLDGAVVVRSASHARAVRALLAVLDACAPAEPEHVPVDAHLLVGPRETVLVGGWFREVLDLAEARLARRGWRFAPAPRAVVDRATFEVVVGPSRLGLDDAAWAGFVAEHPPERGEGVPLGRYPVTRVLLAGSEPAPERLAAPSQRLAALTPLLDTTATGRIDPADVEWLWTFARHRSVTWRHGLDDQELLAVIERRPPPPRAPLPR